MAPVFQGVRHGPAEAITGISVEAPKAIGWLHWLSLGRRDRLESHRGNQGPAEGHKLRYDSYLWTAAPGVTHRFC